MMGGLSAWSWDACLLLPADKRRLKIVEILPIDARRKDILLKRDDKSIWFFVKSDQIIESYKMRKAQSHDVNFKNRG